MASRMAGAMANRMAKPMRSLWQNYAPNPNPNPNPTSSLALAFERINESIHRLGSRGTGSRRMDGRYATGIGGIS